MGLAAGVREGIATSEVQAKLRTSSEAARMRHQPDPISTSNRSLDSYDSLIPGNWLFCLRERDLKPFEWRSESHLMCMHLII